FDRCRVDGEDLALGDGRGDRPDVDEIGELVLGGVTGATAHLVGPVDAATLADSYVVGDDRRRGHAASDPAPVSSVSTRATRLRTSGTLNALSRSGAAAASSASAAARKRASLGAAPINSCSARRARHGCGATAPSAIRTSRITPSATSTAAAIDATAKAYGARPRTLRYVEPRRTGRGGIPTAVTRSPGPRTVSRVGSSSGPT